MLDPKREDKILDFWKDNKIFEKSLELRQKAKHFVFFEGPPTANGRPGIHHFLGRAFKDLFCRYKTMRGFYVLRKAGWDTHGLPVELEIEKELGFKNKKDIEAYGIDKFNKKAKESVWKYKKEWEDMTKKMGFWLDEKHPYITYETNYIESLWHIIKEIWDKGLLYLAHRVVPFCTRCGTPLSSHEVAQGYQKVKERSVYIKFKLISQPDTYILAWTTTPWTLPGNMALAIGNEIIYVLAKKNSEKYILAKDLAEKVLGTGHEIEKEMKGEELVGLEYEPLFDVKELKSDKSYKVYDADFVSTGDGTGVVHTAVMYGEDDYNLGTKIDLPKFHTVDEQGKFIHVGNGLDGLYVKDKQTDNLIIEILEKNHNLLKTEEYEHDYPFCWRCGTPLLYYAKNSWFIKMSAINKELLENNQKINWIPEHIKEGRFGQWIKEGKDWAFSRERYWGTPLPIWVCGQCDNKTTIGSVKELEKLSVGSKNIYYIMRHGLTTRDELGVGTISTRLENDTYHLTDEGKVGVEHSLELLKLDGVDLIYTSPFNRTQETAGIAGKIFHHKIKIDDRLSEISIGIEYEGKGQATYVADHQHFTMDSKSSDSESRNDVRKRLMDFMAELETKYRNKKILIISHGDPLWLLNAISAGLGGDAILYKNNEAAWYPTMAEIHKLSWQKIPRNELGELDLHRPYIDSVILKCDTSRPDGQECNSDMKKIPDLIDVWFDSGAMPYAQWHWPFENKKVFKEQFPADFISEGIDQTRGWFYLMLCISTLLGKGAPYKNVISYSHVLDEKGQKMSKSRGNVVSPFEVMEKFGADAPRWYFYTINSPGDYKMFNEKDVQGKLVGFISTLQNCIRFYELYGNEKSGALPNGREINLLDKWILSRFNGLVQDVTDGLDKYEVTQTARAIEKFVVEDFSNWWLRRSRKRKEALGLLRSLLLEIAKILAPFVPFSAEDIHIRLHHAQTAGIQSIHLHDWPKVNKKLIDKELEKQMEEVQNIVTLGLAERKEKQIKVRQPLRAIHLGLSNEFPKDLEDLLKGELNVKEIVYDNSQKESVILNTELDGALIYEGYARELMRQIQDMRKEAGYKVDDEVFGQWHSDNQDLSSAINKWSDEIKKEVLLKNFENSPQGDKVFDIQKEFDLVPQKKIWIGIKK